MKPKRIYENFDGPAGKMAGKQEEEVGDFYDISDQPKLIDDAEKELKYISNRTRRLMIYLGIFLIVVPLITFGVILGVTFVSQTIKNGQFPDFDEETWKYRVEKQGQFVKAMLKEDKEEMKRLMERYDFIDMNWRHNSNENQVKCRNWPKMVDATPLEIACACNKSKEIVDFLIEHGANVNREGRFHPLHYLAGNGHAENIKLLIEKGANVDAQIKHDTQLLGFSPLMMAAKFGQSKAVDELLANGANALLANKNGESPLKISLQSNQHEMVENLLHHVKTLDQPLPSNVDKEINSAVDWLKRNAPRKEIIEKNTIKSEQ